MDQIPIHNDGKNTIYIGSAAVAPGETRVFEAWQVPPHLRPHTAEAKAEIAEPAHPFAELLKGTVATVSAGIEGLSVDDLNQLADAERDGQNRKGVLGAIAEQIIALGQKKADADAAAGQDGNPPGDGGTKKQGDE